MNDPRSPLEPPSPTIRAFHEFAGSPSTSTGLFFLNNGQQRCGEEWHNKITQENISVPPHSPQKQKDPEIHSAESTTTYRQPSQSLHSDAGNTPYTKETFFLPEQQSPQRINPYNKSRCSPQRFLIVSTFIVCSLNFGFILRHDLSTRQCP